MNNDYRVFYKSGKYVNILDLRTNNFFRPDYNCEKDYLYEERLINIDGRDIDLLNEDNILKINTSITIEENGTSVGRLDNDLRFSASSLLKLGYTKQALLVYRKALDIAERHLLFWEPNIFISYVELLYSFDYDSEAEEYCVHIRKLIKKRDKLISELPKNQIKLHLQFLKKTRSDYLQVGYHYSASEDCAKHRARIYSVSGKDKRFPKIPKYAIKNGKFNDECMCSITPCLDYFHIFAGVDESGNSISYTGEEAITYSNRPFVDDRTPTEVESYTDWKERQSIRLNMYVGFEEKARKKGKREKAYRLICENLPEIAPKSITGFANMQNKNTKNYQTLRAKMLERGIDIENN